MNSNNNVMTLITHDDTFHADDVFAYAVLKEVFKNHRLIRTRDKEILKTGDIVFDVGDGKYDHHGTHKIYRENNIPYASFGLIWNDYGKEYLRLKYGNMLLDKASLQEVFQTFDKVFIEAIDAEDNGVNVMNTTEVEVHTVSSIISSFNNQIDSHDLSDIAQIKYSQNKYFKEATEFAGKMMDNIMAGILNKIRSKSLVEECFNQRKNPAVVFLESGSDWEETIWALDKKEEVLFIVYPKPDGYYLQVVRKDNKSFTARKDLPKEWGGKRDEELSNIIGISDAIFCHSGLFLAGAKSYESIQKMLNIALNN